ncbi:hypothetical protein MMC26_005201 [Xylographa opegraphella]|nr:hypothetical protein [Xylographa opegraphella]
MYSNVRKAQGLSQSHDLLRLEDPPASQKGSAHEESFPSSVNPSSPVYQPDQQVTLQVGEQRFTTTADTLTRGSHYFEKMLSGRWPREAQEDGSYFVDADGSLFKYVLQYLRHNVFPIHYDRVKGHDFGFYAALLEQARFFGVENLEKWLKNKSYLEVVRTEYHARQLDSVYSVKDRLRSDVEVEYHPAWTTKRVYVCPRRITFHRGNPDACGRACKNAQGDADDEYVKEMELDILAIEKKTVFVQELCFDGSVNS